MSEYLISRFEQAADLLPDELKQAADKLSGADKAAAEEFRLRAGRPFTILMYGDEKAVDEDGVTYGNDGRIVLTVNQLMQVLDTVTCSSMHSAIESIRTGFVTAAGGHRVGICGTAVVKDGEVANIKSISSLCIRIAKEIKGVSDMLINELRTDGEFESTLLISPPGIGKTTLLRDIIRRLSELERVSIADERGEIAAARDGILQFDVGPRADVLGSCPKALAIMSLLRSMSPQIIAADEVTAPEDIKAMEQAANCGVKLLATAHAHSVDDLYSRPLYNSMLGLGIFRKLVTIRIEGGKRSFFVTDLR